ncbi:MAG TPA: LacI family DNA-binding transcriptional regulator [Pseudogracilibacillus sp.]|nr:LacI family DNA-binding transcriptional regulator [Pseudogracilibacillus sp.]
MVSSKDVAKKANVSQSTVSRVMNQPHKVNPVTRNKVLEVIKNLNYRPNSIARSLVSKETMSIALISGQLHNPFFAESTTSIVEFANSKGFSVNVHFDDLQDNLNVYQDVLNQQVDGIILSSILYNDPIYDELINQDVPFVMFNRKNKNIGNFVEMDNFKAGFLGAECLIENNHQEIIWIGGALSTSTFYGRHTGFLAALDKHNLSIQEANTIITDTTENDVHDKIIRVMARKNRPTAIFAATDSIALYIMDILSRHGFHIPQDISIVGVDNVSYSSHGNIQLSTIGIVEEDNLGKIAIEYLIDLINDKNKSLGVIQKTIDTKLINRGTIRKV